MHISSLLAWREPARLSGILGRHTAAVNRSTDTWTGRISVMRPRGAGPLPTRPTPRGAAQDAAAANSGGAGPGSGSAMRKPSPRARESSG
jgi:hypothetical protein